MEKNTAQNKIAYLYAEVLKASTREKLHGFHFFAFSEKLLGSDLGTSAPVKPRALREQNSV